MRAYEAPSFALRPVNPEVAGSSPVEPANSSNELRGAAMRRPTHFVRKPSESYSRTRMDLHYGPVLFSPNSGLRQC